jgi:hypothetical protein
MSILRKSACHSDCLQANLQVKASAQFSSATRFGPSYAAVSPTGLVRKIFDLTTVSRLIPTHNDVDSAIAVAVDTAPDDAESAAPATAHRLPYP